MFRQLLLTLALLIVAAGVLFASSYAWFTRTADASPIGITVGTWRTVYQVLFVNAGDPAPVLQESGVAYGETPVYNGATPEKPADAQFTYTFSGWDPPIGPVIGTTVYTAQYDSTINSYTVRFVNGNGTVLQEDVLEYGQTPAYTGETPEKSATAQYTYAFSGWTPDISEVTGDAEYTATFTRTVNTYNIRFLNWDGTELESGQVPYGQVPAYSGAAPEKPADDEYTYDFAGWEPAVVSVTGEATYTAIFTAQPIGAGTETETGAGDVETSVPAVTSEPDAGTESEQDETSAPGDATEPPTDETSVPGDETVPPTDQTSEPETPPEPGGDETSQPDETSVPGSPETRDTP